MKNKDTQQKTSREKDLEQIVEGMYTEYKNAEDDGWPEGGRDWLAYGDQPPPSIPDGRLVPDADILARVDRVMDTYKRSGSSPAFVSAIINDLDSLIDGGGDADILRHYEGWGMQDLVQLVTILNNKFRDIEGDDETTGMPTSGY